MKIKEILSKFLPVPAKTFHAKIWELTGILERLRQNDVHQNIVIDDIKQLSNNLTNYIYSELNEQRNFMNYTYTELNEHKNLANYVYTVLGELRTLSSNEFAFLRSYIHRNINDYIYYTNESMYEQDIAKKFFEFRKTDDFEQCYMKLIIGLDDDSRREVSLLHKRAEMIQNGGNSLDIFTCDEQELMRYRHDFIAKRTLKISDEWYCMGEYIMPDPRFFIDVFFDKLGTDLIYDKERIINKCIMDVGAFIGDSLLIFSKLTNKQIYCFEPMAKNFEILDKTITLNNINSAVPVKAGLGEKKCKLNFSFIYEGPGSRISMKNDEVTEEVDVLKLDDFVDENQIEVGLIKVDIEGSEQSFLKGAKKTIFEQKPVLIIAIYHNPEDFHFLKPEIESWNLGYSFKIFNPVEGSAIVGATLIAEVR